MHAEEAQALLPSWVGWLPLVTFPLIAFLLSGLAVRLGVAAAAPRRRPEGDSWTERARGAYPVRVAYAVGGLLLPVLLAILSAQSVGPMSRTPLPLVVGLAWLAGQAAVVPRRLERRADTIARAHEPEDGAYARALARIYQTNLIPAVSVGRGRSHPHLHDRLVAAGATPTYLRPKPPSRLRAGAALILSMTAGVLGWYGLQLLHGQLRPPEPSERRALWSIALTGGDAVLLSDLAQVRVRAGRLQEATTLYGAAAELEPRDHRHLSNLAIVLARRHRCDEAMSVLAEGDLAGPESKTAVAAVATCRETSGP